MTRSIELRVNGTTHRVEVEDRRLLSDCLRHDLGLRGTRVGCEHGVCGACTVRLDGQAVRSCLLFAVQVEGQEIQTVEGLADPEGPLHPLQEAFHRHGALQCGYCTPGFLLTAAQLLDELRAEPNPEPPSEEEIRVLLAGNLCRCTGYGPIVRAVLEQATGAAGADPTEPSAEDRR
ncbi:(2Fe-2S)-binding protein [Aciditerrimonas ferrireducens]|uniref:(2Fe-2S)-binding protein n=1 Tax=Aciditerrimonas ferrireducens TaxID=667306 RepID=A0ABV6C766_9ACTN